MTTSPTDQNDDVVASSDGEAAAEPQEITPGSESAEDSAETHRFLKGVLEALLFVAEAPLTPKELARAAKIDKKRTMELLEDLVRDYAPRGIQIQEVAGGYCFRSNPEFANYVKSHLAQRPVRLSRAQLETLAIIAYRQPITRPEVDDIRGVDSGPVVKGLLERDLVKILGKKDEPGRPMLYGTTPEFLELFNMRSLQDLPTLKEFTELSDESRRRFEKSLGEDAPEGPLEPSVLGSVEAEGPAGEEAGVAREGAPEGEREEDDEEGEEDDEEGEEDDEEGEEDDEEGEEDDEEGEEDDEEGEEDDEDDD